MLAKIRSGKSVFGVLRYNKIKADDEHTTVLYRQKMFDSPDGKFSIKDCMDSFYPYLTMNNRTEKIVFHASLNPDPKNRLSNEQLSEIAQCYMQKLGYGNQPYIVLKRKHPVKYILYFAVGGIIFAEKMYVRTKKKRKVK